MAQIVFLVAVAIAMLIVLGNSFQEVKKKPPRREMTEWKNYSTYFLFFFLFICFLLFIDLFCMLIIVSLRFLGKKYWKIRAKEMMVAINWKSSLFSVINSPQIIDAIKFNCTNWGIKISAFFTPIFKINSKKRTVIKFIIGKTVRIVRNENRRLLFIRLNKAELFKLKGWLNSLTRSINAPTIHKTVKSIIKENLLCKSNISKKLWIKHITSKGSEKSWLTKFCTRGW